MGRALAVVLGLGLCVTPASTSAQGSAGARDTSFDADGRVTTDLSSGMRVSEPI